MSDQKPLVGFAGLSSLVSRIPDQPQVKDPFGSISPDSQNRSDREGGQTKADPTKIKTKTIAPTKADSKLRKSKEFLVVGALVAGAVLLMWMASDKTPQTSPSYTPYTPAPAPASNYNPPSQPVVPVPTVAPPAIYTQVAPVPGDGTRILSRDNIRWCLYQGRRIEYIRSTISTSRSDEDVSSFNVIVDDFNSRCSRYRFRETDMASIRAELPSKESELQLEAERIVSDWPHRKLALSPNLMPPPESYEQVAPTPGDGSRMLNKENIRWCLYQSRRIDIVRGIISRNDDDVSPFNEIVSDFNGRCSSYRYRETDMASISAELSSKESELQLQAERIVSDWPHQKLTTPNPPTTYSTDAAPQGPANIIPPQVSPGAVATHTRADQTFIGGWAGEASDCPNDQTDEAPLQITNRRAAIGETVCNFEPPHREGAGWRTKATCVQPGKKPWHSNVKILVSGDRLTWSSESGAVSFVRCPGR